MWFQRLPTALHDGNKLRVGKQSVVPQRVAVVKAVGGEQAHISTIEPRGTQVAAVVKPHGDESEIEIPDRSCRQSAAFVAIHIAAARSVRLGVLRYLVHQPPVGERFGIDIFVVYLAHVGMRRIELLLDFIEHTARFFLHSVGQRVGRLDVDRQMAMRREEARVTVVVRVEFEEKSFIFIDFNAATRNSHLLAQQIDTLRPSVEHHIHRPAVGSPGKRRMACHLKGKHVAQLTVVHEIGKQSPTLAGSHSENGMTAVEFYGVWLLRLGKRGMSATLDINVMRAKIHGSIGSDNPHAAVFRPDVARSYGRRVGRVDVYHGQTSGFWLSCLRRNNGRNKAHECRKDCA